MGYDAGVTIGGVKMQSGRSGDPSTEPRTISGRAWLSGMRPHHRRAAMPLIVSIESEAVSPFLDALREADAVLADLAALDHANADADLMRALVDRARVAHDRARTLLDRI
jgi:hypothetical protein